jgi:hypothetical protein
MSFLRQKLSSAFQIPQGFEESSLLINLKKRCLMLGKVQSFKSKALAAGHPGQDGGAVLPRMDSLGWLS